MTYLDSISFDDPKGSDYEVGVDEHGIIVLSECCGSRMSDEVAAKVHEALGRYLADREAGKVPGPHHTESPTPGG